MTLLPEPGANAATQLAAELRRRTGAEVDVTNRRRAEYSTDASNYRVVPQAVVFPRNTDDIEATLAVCREQGVPLTMRGGGTSCAGNAVGPGVVLDTTRHLDKVVELDPDARTAVVQPGTIADTVTAAGAAHGLRFGPDPSTHARCTIGGMIGNNSCGAHTLAYGRTDANIAALDVLTGDGRRMTLDANGGTPLRALGFPELEALVRTHLGTIRTELGRFSRQVSGYALEHLLPENGGNVARALVGSEGTAAIVLRRDREARRIRTGHGARRARLPRHGVRGRGGAAAARPPPARARGRRRQARRRRPPEEGRVGRTGPAPRGRLAHGRDGRRHSR